jgi:hypothetical protein
VDLSWKMNGCDGMQVAWAVPLALSVAASGRQNGARSGQTALGSPITVDVGALDCDDFFNLSEWSAAGVFRVGAVAMLATYGRVAAWRMAEGLGIYNSASTPGTRFVILPRRNTRFSTSPSASSLLRRGSVRHLLLVEESAFRVCVLPPAVEGKPRCCGR